MLPLKQKVPYKRECWVDLLKQKGPQYIHQFSEMTTLHGVRYLGERNRCLLERVFWGLALVVTYSSCFYFIALMSSEWRSSPVVMSSETHATSTWTIPSPAVTVCTTTHISKQKINFSTICSWKNLSSLMEARLDVIRELCGIVVDKGTDFLNDEAVDYVINNYLPDLRRVFVSVNRMNHDIEPLEEHVQTIITPVSVCLTHNMLPLNQLLRPEFLNVYQHYGLLGTHSAAHPQSWWTPDQGYQSKGHNVTPMRLWGNGYYSSTKYMLSVSDLDYDSTCSNGDKALSVYLHNPAEVPWRVHNNIFLKTDNRVAVFITPLVTCTDDVVKVWSPLKRGCFFEKERYLRFFQIYTQRNCEKECESNNTLKYCGCVLISHPRNISMPICGPKKHACVEQSQEEVMQQEMRTGKDSAHCGCLPSCNEIDFMAEAHFRPWKFSINSVYATVPSEIDLNKTSISLMAIAVKKKYLNVTKRTALMGSAALVANIGGILSLFLGISFLSLFEVVYFMTLRVFTNIWNMKKKERWMQQNTWATKVDYNSKIQPFIN